MPNVIASFPAVLPSNGEGKVLGVELGGGCLASSMNTTGRQRSLSACGVYDPENRRLGPGFTPGSRHGSSFFMYVLHVAGVEISSVTVPTILLGATTGPSSRNTLSSAAYDVHLLSMKICRSRPYVFQRCIPFAQNGIVFRPVTVLSPSHWRSIDMGSRLTRVDEAQHPHNTSFLGSTG